MAVPQRKNEEFDQRFTNDQKDPLDDKTRTIDQAKTGFAANDPIYNKRRMGSDRTDLNQPDRTRNIHYTSSMPGAPGSRPGLVDTKEENPHPSTDISFSDSYAKTGTQAQYRGGKEIEKKKDSSGVRDVQGEYTETPPQRTDMVSRGVKTKQRRIKLRNKVNKGAALSRTRASAANTIILAWAAPLWISFQVPLAVINMIFLGLMAVVSEMLSANPDDGMVTSVLKAIFGGVVGGLSWIADKINDLTGWDLSVVNPGNFWAVTEMIMFGYMVFVIFLMYIQYKLFFLEPIWGKGGGMKFGALLFMAFGYLVPVFNLFPWFLVWSGAVWLSPK